MNPRTELWDRVYSTSMDVYSQIPDFGDRDARLTADIAGDNWYRSGALGNNARRRQLRGLSQMPAPGDLLRLGAFLEVEWVLPNGEIRGARFHPGDGVDALWSDTLQAVIVVPHARLGPCTLPPTRREAQLLAIWARGRAARCSLRATYNLAPLPIVYPAIQLSYRSDKFSPGEPKNYIHHIDSRGVLAYFSSEPYGASRAPQAIMIRGGKLRLTPHGIAG